MGVKQVKSFGSKLVHILRSEIYNTLGSKKGIEQHLLKLVKKYISYIV